MMRPKHKYAAGFASLVHIHAFQELTESALRTHQTLVAFVRCEVTYSGRAETFLPEGDRMIVLKPDGTLLIHQPEGSAPVNYMKSGTEVSFSREDGAFTLSARNAKEKAWLTLAVRLVYGALAQRLEDGQQLDLAGNERDMSDWIRDNPRAIGASFRPVAREEQTDVGFIDVLGHDGKDLVVVECKRVTASLSAVDQLRRYVERVQQVRGAKRVKGVLAAPDITPNALEMLTSWGFAFRKVEPLRRLERWQKGQARLGEY